MKTTKPTGIEAEVCRDIASRQRMGLAKYGQSVADNPLTLREWLRHAYEEALDSAVYLRRAIDEMDRNRGEEVDVALRCLRAIEAKACGIGGGISLSDARTLARVALSALHTLPSVQKGRTGQAKAKARGFDGLAYRAKAAAAGHPSPRMGTLPKSGSGAGAGKDRASRERKNGPKT